MTKLQSGHGGARGRWLGIVLAIVTMALISAPASQAQAESAPNMFTTNVPYVAWRGEQVRAVKCDSIPQIYDGDGVLNGRDLRVDVLVESWSGPGRDPQLETGTVQFFRSRNLPESQRDCVRFDMVSSDPGLARVKLVISDRNGVPILKHQFLFVWMSLGTIGIKEATNNDPPVPPNSQSAVADPSGDGNFHAGDQAANKGRVQIKVTGTFPHPLGPGGTFTLPQDWPLLASLLATTNDPYNFNPSMMWDIHGALGMGVGPYGPWDPARMDTLLSDGHLTAADAPMPAARVDVAIKPNSGNPGDISGVGSLAPADKTMVYSHDGNGTISPGNLYEPYYSQWIPATSQGSPEASGIDGPQRGNNFEGFFLSGLYHNWDTFPLVVAHDGPTACNQFVSWERTLGIRGGQDVPRLRPGGPQTVAVYTDEHGEAQVEYRPGDEFYFDNLPVLINDNRGCDLQNIDVLGTSAISATAEYPYQPVDASPITSATVQKTVHNLFNKSLSYYPKGPVTDSNGANDNARIVVAHANDIDGTPFAGELVCWMLDSNAEGSLPFSGTTGPANGRFQVSSRPVPLGHIPVQVAGCSRTDANGNVAIEVFNSNHSKVNVIALFADEGLMRDIKVDFAAPGSTGGTPPPAGNGGPVTPPAPASLGTTPPTQGEIVAAAGQNGATALAPATGSGQGSPAAKPGKTTRIALVRTKYVRGKGHVWVRVNSRKSHVRIKIRLSNGRTITRTIRTNRLVEISHLVVGKGVGLKASLIG